MGEGEENKETEVTQPGDEINGIGGEVESEKEGGDDVGIEQGAQDHEKSDDGKRDEQEQDEDVEKAGSDKGGTCENAEKEEHVDKEHVADADKDEVGIILT